MIMDDMLMMKMTVKILVTQHIPTMTDSHHGGNMPAMKVV